MNIQQRIQSEIEKFQRAIHKALVPLQRDAYLCMAECSDPERSPEQIERCYKKCQRPMEKADQHVQFTVNSFQRDMNQCELECNDGSKNKEEFERCVTKCATKVLNRLPDDTDELLTKLSQIETVPTSIKLK